MIVTESFYAARGDTSLKSVNSRLGGSIASIEDFTDLRLSRQNDGVWVTLARKKSPTFRVLSTSPQDKAWFQQGTFPSEVFIVFAAPVDKTLLEDTSFRWVHSSTESVTPTWSDLDRVATVPGPDLDPEFKGELTLILSDLKSTEGEDIEGQDSFTFVLSDETTLLARVGEQPKQPTYGRVEIARVVVSWGMRPDRMLEAFLKAKNIEQKDVLKVAQVEGPNQTVELFVLWFSASTPKVLSVSPAASSTINSDDVHGQIVLQFDQPVNRGDLLGEDGVNRVIYNGTPIQNIGGVMLTLLDSSRKKFMFSAPTLFNVNGHHRLMLQRMPNQFGKAFAPPHIISWQRLPIGAVTSAGTAYCHDYVGNGVQTDFPLTADPMSCTLHVYLNGVFQHPGCYAILPNMLSMGQAPGTGEQLRAMYRGEA